LKELWTYSERNFDLCVYLSYEKQVCISLKSPNLQFNGTLGAVKRLLPFPYFSSHIQKAVNKAKYFNKIKRLL
jgi:hypothetical protein